MLVHHPLRGAAFRASHQDSEQMATDNHRSINCPDHCQTSRHRQQRHHSITGQGQAWKAPTWDAAIIINNATFASTATTIAGHGEAWKAPTWDKGGKVRPGRPRPGTRGGERSGLEGRDLGQGGKVRPGRCRPGTVDQLFANNPAEHVAQVQGWTTTGKCIGKTYSKVEINPLPPHPGVG